MTNIIKLLKLFINLPISILIINIIMNIPIGKLNIIINYSANNK